MRLTPYHIVVRARVARPYRRIVRAQGGQEQTSAVAAIWPFERLLRTANRRP